MAEELKVAITIEVDDKGSVKLKDIGEIGKDSLKKIEEQSEKTTSGFAGMWKQVALGTLVYDAFKKALSFAKDTLKSAITEAIEAEEAQMKLNQALRAAGIYTPELSEKYQKFASNIQDVSKYSDEAVMSVMAFLTQVGRVGPGLIKEATKATINYAAGIGKDLQTAALDLSKAFEGNLAMLQKWGVRVTEAAITTKGLQRAIIEAIETKFGGQMEAEAMTARGAMAQLKNIWSEVLEKIGFAIIKNREIAETFFKVKEAIKGMDVEGLTRSLSDLVSTGINTVKVLYQFGDAVISLTSSMAKLLKYSTEVQIVLQGWKSLWVILTGELGKVEDAQIKAISQQVELEKKMMNILREVIREGGLSMRELIAKYGEDITKIYSAILRGKEGKELQELLRNVASRFNETAKSAKETGEKITESEEAWKRFSETIKATDARQVQFTSSQKAFIEKLIKSGMSIEEIRKAMEESGIQINTYSSAFKKLSKEIEENKKKTEELKKAQEELLKSAIMVPVEIENAYKLHLPPARKILKDSLSLPPDELKQIENDHVKAWRETWDKIEKDSEETWGFIKSIIITNLADALSGAKSFSDVMRAIWDGLKQYIISFILKKIVEAFEGSFSKITGFLSNLMSSVVGGVSSATSTITGAVSVGVSSIGVVVGAAALFLTGLFNSIKSQATWMEEAARRNQKNQEEFSKKLEEQWERIKKPAQEVLDVFVSLGKAGLMNKDIAKSMSDMLLEQYKILKDLGLSTQEIFLALGGNVGELEKILKSLGIEITEELEEIFKLYNQMKAVEPILNALESVSKLFEKLGGNVKTLSDERLKTFQQIGITAFEALIKQGFSADEAFKLLGKNIQDILIEAYKRLGKTGSEELDKILGRTKDIVGRNKEWRDTLDEIIDRYRRTKDAIDEVSRAEEGRTPPGGGGGRRWQMGFQGWVTTPTKALIAEREPEFVSVIPRSKMSSIVNNYTTNYPPLHITINAWDSKDVERWFKEQGVKFFEKAMKGNIGGYRKLIQENI